MQGILFHGKGHFGPTVTKYLDGSGIERKWHKNICPLETCCMKHELGKQFQQLTTSLLKYVA
jgi:hypothetical protein